VVRNKGMQNKRFLTAAIVLIAAVAFTLWSAKLIRSSYQVEPIVKGPSVTKVERLSKYFSAIKGTPR
jgi:hypothetical protein